MLWQIERDPFGKLRGTGGTRLEGDLDRLFRVGFGPGAVRRAEATGSQATGKSDDRLSWAPSVDISENEQSIVLEADLPGLKAEDFRLSIENQVLTLSGERRRQKDVDAEGSSRYQRVERQYGSFRRSFTLPTTVNIERVAADYRDGVLRVTMPKREETRPRQIEVSVRTEPVVAS